ncbi:hypothetical protein FA13DRAFT_1705462 [Coprinellus micaceus]|uniref:Uncharacterized protein n=1 Tax=Coprinellus micaceus TaxID=71717 RepID=A0A4Y7TSP5_COPMI|nr:hypothetical protein FA13DRAFT_1705462 [Coprinellus micaceus]
MSVALEKKPCTASIVPTSDPTEVELSPPFGDAPSSLDDRSLEYCPAWAGGSIDYRNMMPIYENTRGGSHCHTATLTEHPVHKRRRSSSPSRGVGGTVAGPDACKDDRPVSTPFLMQPGPSTQRTRTPAASTPPGPIQVQPLPSHSFVVTESQAATAVCACQDLRGKCRNPSTKQPVDPTTKTTFPLASVTLAPAERKHVGFQLELIDIEVAVLAFKRRRLLGLIGSAD